MQHDTRRQPNRQSASRGQSLVEFVLVVPILLLLFAAAADLGRAFYAYVAIENGVKEGVFYGSRAPLCTDDTAAGCGNPRNVEWRVQNELATLRNPDGTQLVPTSECLDQATDVAHTDMADCAAGDTYVVSLTYPFKFLTPILGDILGGTLNLKADSSAVVLNVAFDPTPGASVQKLVRVANAVNGAAIVSNCLEPDEFDSAGYYRSPCHDTLDAGSGGHDLTPTFESGVSIQYKVTVGNSGGQTLTGVTVVDSTGATGCTFPTTWNVGYTNQPTPGCTYNRTAPNVPVGQSSIDYPNVLTVDATEINPEQDTNTVKVQPPPPNWKIDVYVSPFALGDDGDGNPNFGTLDDARPGRQQHPYERVGVVQGRHPEHRRLDGYRRVDRVDTRSVAVRPERTRTRRATPMPATLAAGATFTCRYKVDAGYGGHDPEHRCGQFIERRSARSTRNVATVNVTNCANPSRLIPNLISLTKTNAMRGLDGRRVLRLRT